MGDVKFGIPGLEDMSVPRLLNTVAPLVPRNYVVMRLKGNLLPEERKESLSQFFLPQYKKVARVLVGEPPDDFKKLAYDAMLKEKQHALDAEYRKLSSDREHKIRVKENM